MSKTFTVFLYPSGGASGTALYNSAPGAQGPIISGGCSTVTHSVAYPCQATITGLVGGGPPGPYLVHFLNIYDQSNVRIGAVDTAGRVVHMVGGQAVIDATGKAQDVLKRLQVHVPLRNVADVPPAALQGTNICKRQQTGPTDVNNPLGTRFIIMGGSADAAAGDPCYLSN